MVVEEFSKSDQRKTIENDVKIPKTKDQHKNLQSPTQSTTIIDKVKMYEELAIFENEIRTFICSNLREKYNEFWIRNAIPKAIRKNWNKRKELDKKEGKPPESNLINYSDFSDYKEIIFHNWKLVFSKYFKDKEKLRVRLDDLNNLCRKTTMHNRTISHEEMGHGEISIRWLRSKMNMEENN